MEESLVLIKPDAVERCMVGELISDYESRPILALTVMQMTPLLCRQHYQDHIGRHYYPPLEEFMCSGPLVAMILEGPVSQVRQITLWIRQDYEHLITNPRNLVHASDSVEAARREVALWTPYFNRAGVSQAASTSAA